MLRGVEIEGPKPVAVPEGWRGHQPFPRSLIGSSGLPHTEGRRGWARDKTRAHMRELCLLTYLTCKPATFKLMLYLSCAGCSLISHTICLSPSHPARVLLHRPSYALPTRSRDFLVASCPVVFGA
jgi:hypothetical protein